VRIFVDTSALLAILDDDDEHHVAALTTLATLERTAALISHSYVLVEAIALCRRRLGAAGTAILVDSLLPTIETAWVDESLHRAGLVAYRAGGGASFVDQVSFEFMRRQGIDVAFAFDADFEAAGFTPPVIRAPSSPDRRLSEAPAGYGSGDADADLVSVSEIAARAGSSTNTVQSWRRRHRDFPAPVARLAAGPVWTWPDVARWIHARSAKRSSEVATR
jgi:predicted nucleic acid-binding protein